MKTLTSKKKLTSSIIVSSALIGLLLACGPFYTPRLLDKKNTIITNPISSSNLLFPNNKKQYQHNKHLEQLPVRMLATLNTDLTDLKTAAPDIKEEIFNRYKAIRTDMLVTQWNTSSNTLKSKLNLEQSWLDESVLKALPQEFSIYLRGAVAYRTGKTEVAREHWKAILTLPEAEREQRSIWSAWMLARTSTISNKDEAMKWYNEVKLLKNAGFPDSLEVTSHDWTAHFSEKSGDYLTALDIYIKEGEKGITDPIETNNNIRHVLYQADTHLKNDPKAQLKFLQLLAENQERSIAYSHAVRREHSILHTWVKVLQTSERANIDIELGICASIAHNLNDQETLTLCLNSMQNPTIESLWLNAQLATLNGELKEASKLYQSAVELIQSKGYMIDNNFFHLYSEYASVELGRKNYAKALDLFITADEHSSDAAYIAETLLSPTEMLVYYRESEIAQQSEFIKNLLKRKLMRNDYFKDAKPFVLESELTNYQLYCYAYRTAIDPKVSVNMRVEAFQEAAKIAKNHHSSELFHLENGCRPFVRIHDAGVSVHEKYDFSDSYKKLYAENTSYTPPMTEDEISRIKKHYIRISPVNTTTRHVAELYYRAAMLLPKGDKQAAKLFWKAGDLTRTDSQVADKYYQALIKRCFNTELAQACDQIRWFIKPEEIAANSF